MNIVKNKNDSLFSLLSFSGKIFFCFVLFITIFTFVIDIQSSYYVKKLNFLQIIRSLMFFFTKQTIFFILIVLLLFLFNIKNKKLYYYIFFMSIVDALIIGVVYNTILSALWTTKSDIYKFSIFFQKNNFDFSQNFLYQIYESHVISIFQHLLVPFFYFLFFLFFVPLEFKINKKIFYTFFHCLGYLFFWFLCLFIVEGCHNISSSDDCWLPYFTIQCPIHGELFGKQIFGFSHELAVLIRIFFLTILFTFIFAMVFSLKNNLNKKFLFRKKNVI
ncbi:hypothetical protein FEF22_000300 [Texas Phoenix palm phytoplasma]|uniref:Uncharacterized protein n=1 Tax=Texas Phoenix palm phytoplasma TaxID=176709 RepID=A0ABS5BI22_9MOLU|nr:hypothetical protein [Texas Phoenix palm phytoplasma]MBP3059230.1 hypothetical protein [Texas Phoenix palm phytoplasma]